MAVRSEPSFPEPVWFGSRRAPLAAGVGFAGRLSVLGFAPGCTAVALWGTAVVLAGAGLVLLATGGPVPWGLAAIALGAGAVVVRPLLRQPARYLLADGEGIEDAVTGIGRIGWGDVAGVTCVPRDGGWGVLLVLHDPDGTYARLPSVTRLDGSSNSLIPPAHAWAQAFLPTGDLPAGGLPTRGLPIGGPPADPAAVARILDRYRDAWHRAQISPGEADV